MMTPQYNTVTFADIYDEVDGFIFDYHNNGIPTKLKDESMTTLFYLLYARYGNSPIANMDREQWKYKLFATVFMYGPTWEKKLEIQDRLRNLTDEELATGSKTISNVALNPGDNPSTDSLESLPYINQQNTTNFRRSKIDGFADLWAMLRTDITSDFLARFISLFKKFVEPENPLLYSTDLDVEGDE